MTDKTTPVQDQDNSPALGPDWAQSRWGSDDQRGNGNLQGPAKVLEALSLVTNWCDGSTRASL